MIRRASRSWFRRLATLWLLAIVLGVGWTAPAEPACADDCATACDDGCAEHNCTPFQHHCGCCATAAAATNGTPLLELLPGVTATRSRWPVTVSGPTRSDPPDTRPPIV